jgi:aconitate hydratase
MIKLIDKPVYLLNGGTIADSIDPSLETAAADGAMAWSILKAHNSGDDTNLKIKFDALASHDITYVGILQTARASGLKEFPVPYVLTNCHNSLCAVGGTINEDDHLFGLSAAEKYGGNFVPAHLAVIHTYMRERHAAPGMMILGSDSHTRYGALGTLGIGEGGPELVKQLLGRSYDLKRPQTALIWLTGAPRPGVGPHDVALAVIAAVFEVGFVKNRIMEFAGPGVAALSMDFRNGVDVMTTETACLSSIWITDEKTKSFLTLHGRGDAYKELKPAAAAKYDCAVLVDLSEIRPMIALPFHPSNAYPIEEFNKCAGDMLRAVEKNAALSMNAPGLALRLTDKLEGGRLRVEQGVIAGCAGGTFENLALAAGMLKGRRLGPGAFALSVYPGSQPVMLGLMRAGLLADLIASGATLRTAFCGPCFGAGDVPANQGLSIRHTTRNFPNREGSQPHQGQAAAVALMDARSIAATAAHEGLLTPATEFEIPDIPEYAYDDSPYRARVYTGFGRAIKGAKLRFGPNIADWPEMRPLPENIVLEIASAITDPVTTTDELIPSGETSSWRSNPMKLAEFTLSRKDSGYVGRAKAARALEEERLAGENGALGRLSELTGLDLFPANTGIGSAVYAVKPGDGSAREQAASCQRVLGGWANIAREYATKRYRSNLCNWGILPFLFDTGFVVGQRIVIPGIRKAVAEGKENIEALLIEKDDSVQKIRLKLPLDKMERPILLAGSLINYYAEENKNGKDSCGLYEST